tara:strand:- start:91 stop:1626 length:1536 start_codon:yes stop_codon:yes gene_type:complete
MTNSVIVSPHYLSSEAGKVVIEKGGNAIDAAIAVNIVQGVVAPETCGIGGDLFALIWINGDEKPYCLDSSGYAGSNVDTIDFSSFQSLPLNHEATATVPGAVKGWESIHNKFGKLSFEDLFQEAIKICNEGFEVSVELNHTLNHHQDSLRKQNSSENFYVDGKPVEVGNIVRREKLGKTLSSIATKGSSIFYEGDIAKAISKATKNTLTEEDINNFVSKWVSPLKMDIYGKTGWVTPPHTQSYLTLATLKAYELITNSGGELDPHLLIECYRSLAADRDQITYDYGDKVDSFTGLNFDYIKSKVSEIDIHKAKSFQNPEKLGGGTAYMAVKDSEGNAVSLIQSNFYGIGSTIGVSDYGFFLHNRGAGFNLIDNHPNKIYPHRKPLHTLSPTIWSKDGKLDMVIGTRGGRYQPQLLSQFILPILLKSSTPEEAMNKSRWVIDYFGENTESNLIFEQTSDENTINYLKEKGHKITMKDSLQSSFGPISIIYRDDNESWRGVADSRVATAKAIY